MSDLQNYISFGRLAVSEKCIQAASHPRSWVDLVLCFSGWEERGLQSIVNAPVESGRVALLSFDLPTAAEGATDASTKSTTDLCSRLGIEQFDNLKLLNSTKYRENFRVLADFLVKISQEGVRSVFIESSMAPRIYLQFILKFSVQKSLFAAVEFGYCEADYSDFTSAAAFSHGKFVYKPVPLYSGRGGVSGEKSLIVGIGGDDTLFYELIDQYSYDRVQLLVGTDHRYPSIVSIVESQTENAKETFRLSPQDVMSGGAFSVVEYLRGFFAFADSASHDASISVFASGPKAQAIAAAVFGCVDERVAIIARVPGEYAVRQVRPSTGYWLYRVLDLWNPRLGLVILSSMGSSFDSSEP